MKKTILYTILIAVLTLASVNVLKAQAPPHPNQKSNTEAVQGQRIGEAPSGAPVGTGDILLITLAALYAGVRIYSHRKRQEA